MSRTYKDIRKWKTAKFWDTYYANKSKTFCPYTGVFSTALKACRDFVSKNLEYSSHEQLYTDYSGAPSWFTRLYSNLPKKREEKHLLQQATKDPDNADGLIFPLARRPFAYYW